MGRKDARDDVVFTQMDCGECEVRALPRNLGTEPCLSLSEAQLSVCLGREVPAVDVVAVNRGFSFIVFKQRTDREVACKSFVVHVGGLDPLVIDDRTVSMLGKIALGVSKPLDELWLQFPAYALRSQAQRAIGVLNHLNSLQPR